MYRRINNAFRRDPTQTITLRAQYIADVNRRFRALQRLIKVSIVDNDCFGLAGPGNLSFLAAAIDPKKFQYRTNPEKVSLFMQWLEQTSREGILETINVTDPLLSKPGQPWTSQYLMSSYKKGLLKVDGAFAGAQELLTREALFEGALIAPINRETVETIFVRSFEELKGINASMSQAISRELAEGLVNGEGIESLAKRLTDRVEKIGKVRARLLARTETIRAHNEGFLTEIGRVADFLGEPALVVWRTVGDGRVRERHAAWHNKVMTVLQARQRIGEPNCRCGFHNWITSVNGEPPEERIFTGS